MKSKRSRKDKARRKSYQKEMEVMIERAKLWGNIMRYGFHSDY